MAYVIAEPCIGTKDTACVDACPVDCIHPKKDDPKHDSEELLYIDPVECIDCGACVPVCPVSAIFALDDLPEKWADFEKGTQTYLDGKHLPLKEKCPTGLQWGIRQTDPKRDSYLGFEPGVPLPTYGRKAARSGAAAAGLFTFPVSTSACETALP